MRAHLASAGPRTASPPLGEAQTNDARPEIRTTRVLEANMARQL